MSLDRETMLALPFWVNGTATDEERAAIEAALAQDPELRAQADALGAIRARMQAEEINSPGEFGLARLMRDVERIETPLQSAASPDPVMATPVPPARAANVTNRPWIWQLAAAVALIALVGQGLLLRGSDTLPATGSTTGFELASAEVPGALNVAFVSSATEADIRGVLLDAGLEIVAGPSAIGFYRLDLTGGMADETAQQSALLAATQALRAAPTIVEIVEDVER